MPGMRICTTDDDKFATISVADQHRDDLKVQMLLFIVASLGRYTIQSPQNMRKQLSSVLICDSTKVYIQERDIIAI